MVSLENTRNPKGGFSFENNMAAVGNQEQDIENISYGGDTAPLTADLEPNFKKIGVSFAIILQIIVVAIMEVGVFLIPRLCGENDLNCPSFPAFDVIVLMHGAIWFIKLIFDRFYHYNHMKLRRHGYLEFYRLTRYIRALPLFIVSGFNSILVVLLKLVDKFCPLKCTSLNLEPVNFIQIFVSIETILLVPVLVYYLIQTIKFNKAKKSPDINKELDRTQYSPAQLKDVGYRDSTYISSVLENQADMIRYLQERNEKLSKKLNELMEKQTPNATNINC